MSDSEDEDDLYPKAKVSLWEVFWRLLGYIRMHYKRIGVSYIFMFIETPLELAQPYYYNSVIAQALDSTADEYDFEKHLQTIGFVLFLAVLNMVIGEARKNFLGNYEDVIDEEITNDLFKAIINRDIVEFDKYGTEKMAEVMWDTGPLAYFILKDLPEYVKQTIRFPGALYVMFSMSPSLTGIAIAGTPLLAVIEKYQSDYQDEIWSKRVKLRGRDTNGYIHEVLTTIKNVRSFGCERQEVRAVRELQEEKKKAYLKVTLKEKFYDAISETVESFLKFSTILYGGYLIRMGLMTVETFLSFQSYQGTFEECFDDLRHSYRSAKTKIGRAQKAFAFMDKENKVPRDGVLRPLVKGEIKLENVNFNYETRPDNKVLENFNLHIKAGESIALVGPSGGGKSTIISLIERFYGPDSGSIAMDGIPIEEYDDEYYHKQVALVAQEPVLYNRTIRENILYGCDWATEEQMIEAAKMANAHDFISELKEGYDSTCGSMGSQLSGGQKQRIAIARALVRDPSVLLLDEATSALDTESESVVQDALDRCCKDRTVIVIAHRLSTIRNVNKIAVVSGGKVSEFGTHRELMKLKGGLYANLVDRQIRGFVTSSIEEAIEEIQNEEIVEGLDKENFDEKNKIDAEVLVDEVKNEEMSNETAVLIRGA